MLAQTLREMHSQQGGYAYIPPAQSFADDFSSQGGLRQLQPSPITQQNVGWTQDPFPSHPYDHHQPTQQYVSSSSNPYIAPLYQQSSTMGMSIQIHNYTPPASQAGQSHSSSLSPDNNSQGEDSVSVSEDKRRRNTVASGKYLLWVSTLICLCLVLRVLWTI